MFIQIRNINYIYIYKLIRFSPDLILEILNTFSPTWIGNANFKQNSRATNTEIYSDFDILSLYLIKHVAILVLHAIIKTCL